MPELPTIVPVASAAALFGVSKLLGTYMRHASVVRASVGRRRAERGCMISGAHDQASRILAMWVLFGLCNAILLTEDPVFATALLFTAAGSCTLWRRLHGRPVLTLER
jgi:hypothetical protein